MVCEKCGKNQDDFEYNFEIDECPDCGTFLCDDCAGWTVVHNESICAECASNYIPAIDGFVDDITCSRSTSGIQTNVPRRIILHSPTGYGWGYGGSGPADFALNILSIFIGQAEAEIYYQDFKFEFVAKIPHEGGTIKREDILNWIEAKRRKGK